MSIAAQTRALLVTALNDMGTAISRRRLDRLVQVCIAIWAGDETPDMHADPTAREAIRRVMARMPATA